MEPGWDGDVELHEGGSWSVGLCAGVGGSNGGGVGVDVNGADSVDSAGGVGGTVGNGCGNNGRNLGGSWLCGGGIWVKWWEFCGGGGGGFWGGVVVWLEDGFVVVSE